MGDIVTCYRFGMGTAIRGLFKRVGASIVCTPAIFMPYRVRIAYINGLSFILHAPFKLFGKLARFLLNQLNIIEQGDEIYPSSVSTPSTPKTPPPSTRAVVLFSGGTDSTCVAALLAERFEEIHVLTFYEHATQRSPVPTENVERLRNHFPASTFIHNVLSVDALVRFFWYERYIQTLKAHGLLTLSTPGFSSLSWHVRTILYCLEHDITHVADGLTRELMHFPGHIDGVVEIFKEMYRHFGITYENPVRDWETPPDHQFIDQVLINRHSGEFLLGDRTSAQRKTTGRYLFEHGIFPHPSLKGSSLDFSMQHDCYPFALYNILAFWGHLSHESYVVFSKKICALMISKVETATTLLDAYRLDKKSFLVTMLV